MGLDKVKGRGGGALGPGPQVVGRRMRLTDGASPRMLLV